MEKLGKILNKFTSNLLSTKDCKQKIIIKPLNWFRIDEGFANLYTANKEKIKRIIKSLEDVGFDFTQPLICDTSGYVIDGNSRRLAVLEYNKNHPDKLITELPCLIKQFDSKEEALEYEVHLNTDRRSLSDGDLFTSFETLNSHKEKMKAAGKSIADYTDKRLAVLFNISERQVSKLRFVVNNASSELRTNIINNACSINNAEIEIRKKKSVVSGINKSVENHKINKTDFLLGIKFSLSELADGKSPNLIWNEVKSKQKISFSEDQLKEIEMKILSL